LWIAPVDKLPANWAQERPEWKIAFDKFTVKSQQREYIERQLGSQANPALAICRSTAIVVDSVTKTNAVTESRVVESSAGRLP